MHDLRTLLTMPHACGHMNHQEKVPTRWIRAGYSFFTAMFLTSPNPECKFIHIVHNSTLFESSPTDTGGEFEYCSVVYFITMTTFIQPLFVQSTTFWRTVLVGRSGTMSRDRPMVFTGFHYSCVTAAS